jgi:hypothetical protein
MDNVQNYGSYVNITSLQTYRSHIHETIRVFYAQ